MNRRGFLAVLAGLPFVGKLIPKGQTFEVDASHYLKPWPKPPKFSFKGVPIRKVDTLEPPDDHLSKIRSLIYIQKNLHGKDGYKGGQDDTTREYHRGMANGLIVAESVLSGEEPEFVGTD